MGTQKKDDCCRQIKIHQDALHFKRFIAVIVQIHGSSARQHVTIGPGNRYVLPSPVYSCSKCGQPTKWPLIG
jgi:hypothetical protein